MRNIFPILICVLFFQSCFTLKEHVDDRMVDDQFVKRQISLYKRIGDDYRLGSIFRMFITLKRSRDTKYNTYEIYGETGSGIIGKYSMKNDTLILFHEYEFLAGDSCVRMSKLNENDTIPEFYPRKFVVRNDSLIDITNYKDFHGYIRAREDYILVK